MSDVGNFLENDEKTQTFGQQVEHENPFHPFAHELCIAKMNSGLWSRCDFLEIVDLNTARLYCFDYGIICHVPNRNIRVSQIPIDSNIVHSSSLDPIGSNIMTIIKFKLRFLICLAVLERRLLRCVQYRLSH